jgi:hypothetical protein
MRTLSSLTVALLTLTACTVREPTLDDVIAKHVAARGGATAIEAVRVFEGEIEIVEPSFTVDGLYVATRDGSMRVDISAGGERVFTEALDRGHSWSWSPSHGVKEGTSQGAAALRHGIDLPIKLFGLHEMAARGHRLALQGRETIDGTGYHVLRLTLADGFETLYYVNAESGLIERDRQRRAFHVDVNPKPVWIETRYEDHRPVAGVLFAHRQIERELETGELLSTVTLREVRINPPLAPGRFAPP